MSDRADETTGSWTFVSYAHADAEANSHVRLVLERLGTWRHLGEALSPWSDQDIQFGDRWEATILAAIQKARIAILLIGPKFFEAKFICEREVPELLFAAAAGALQIIPILIYGDGELLGRKFKYPHPEKGPHEASLGDFQGIAEALAGMNPAAQLARLGELERKVLEALDRRRVPRTRHNAPVLVVGSGLVENNLLSTARVELDYKHVVERIRCYGGSGVNYATRLGRVGVPVLPILSIGADGLGKEVQQSLLRDCHESVRDFISDDSFLCRGIKTSETYIVINEDQRTTFTESVKGVEIFSEFCYDRLKAALEIADGDFAAIMIGHLYVDDPALGLERCLTTDIAAHFHDRCLVFANFGVSQICRGSGYWKEHLHKLSVLQLTVQEATHFFADEPKRSLLDMLSWFVDSGCTVILTHDAYGAVAVLGGSGEQTIASRFPIEGVVDKTGAGDAFGCGVVCSLLGRLKLDRFSFMGALDEGRKWGAYACTSVGGSNGSPTPDRLEEFKSSVADDVQRVQIGRLSEAWFQDRLRVIWESERVRRGRRG